MSPTAAASEHRSSLDRERSLRRCFMSIHQGIHQPSTPLTPSPGSSHNSESESEASPEIVPKGSYQGGQSFQQRSSRRNPATTPVQCRENLVDSIVPVHELLGLSFSKHDKRKELKSSRIDIKNYRPLKERFSANDGVEMFSELVNEKYQQELPFKKPKQQVSELHCTGFRKDYRLGEIARSSSHIISYSSDQDSSSLKKHDFAFVKRSDGSLSYAILADRSLEPTNGATSKDPDEEWMLFVMSDSGFTKKIRRRSWRKSVCLVSMRDLVLPLGAITQSPLIESPVRTCPRVSLVENHDLFPNMVSFDPIQVMDEECSLISSISDKARMLQRSSVR